MENSTDIKNDPASSMESRLLTRVKFEHVPLIADMKTFFCINPLCPCRTATFEFFHANGRFDNKLFKLVVNYETWQLEASEVFRYDLDYTELADEFMCGLDEHFKAEILSNIGPKAQREHVLRDDIDLSVVDSGNMVDYSGIYRTAPFEDIIFEFEGAEYYVLDHYCPKPTCDCKEVVLSFYLIDGNMIKREPFLAYSVKFETERGIIEDKNSGVSLRFARDLYGGLSKAFGGEAISFFENRYRKIKEWGTAYFGAGST